jgi:microcystin-dependent protein
VTEAFVGEIRMFSFPWAPWGWMLCNGVSLRGDQNMTLYALYSNTFGGSADRNQFNVPDLRGRTPVFASQVSSPFGLVKQGEQGGAENVPLTVANLPSHNHSAQVVGNPTVTANVKSAPAGRIPTDVVKDPQGRIANYYGTPTASTLVPLNPATIGSTGVVNPVPGHPNMQPFAVLNFCLASIGYFPRRD